MNGADEYVVTRHYAEDVFVYNRLFFYYCTYVCTVREFQVKAIIKLHPSVGLQLSCRSRTSVFKLFTITTRIMLLNSVVPKVRVGSSQNHRDFESGAANTSTDLLFYCLVR